MKIETWLRRAQQQLKAAGIGTARLDALVLLEDVSGRDRAWLLAHPEHQLLLTETAELQKLLSRRAKHEPLAYVRGRAEFYGREFVLTPAVLQPRPESETMIDLLKTLVKTGTQGPQDRPHWRLADVGAGSGALGISAKLELPKCEVDLLEIDDKAVKIAKINVDKFTLKLPVIKSDLLAGSSGNYDVLLCNLPYIPDDYRINQAAGQEPAIAIFGGPDGLDLYRRLFKQAAQQAPRPLYILTESLPPQHARLRQIAADSGYTLFSENDFIQVFSCIQKPVFKRL